MKALFNSLGSNYDYQFVFKALFAGNSSRHKEDLTRLLSEKYRGETHLFYKGREAIQAALVLAALPENSPVLITGYTCYAVYKAVVDAGCVPVFVDIESGELNFNATTLKASHKLHPDAKAVIVQNTLGFASDIEGIQGFAKKEGLIVIEDLAHCIGLEYENEVEAGMVGDFVTLSFSQDKVVDGISGGALVVRNSRYNNKAQQMLKYSRLGFRQQLRDRIYPLLTVSIRFLYPVKLGKLKHEIAKRLHLLAKPVDGVFGKYRTLPSWYCKLILDKFKTLPALERRRRAIAEIYAREISEKYQIMSKYSTPTYLRFPVLVKNRQALFNYLKQQQIYITDIWYETPIAPARYLSKTSYQKGSCPQSEELATTMINLPTHQAVRLKDAQIIARKVEAWLSQVEK